MDMKNYNLGELTELVSKFMDFADQLKMEGKISEEQYEHITKNKVEFLKEINSNTYNTDNKVVGEDLFY